MDGLLRIGIGGIPRRVVEAAGQHHPGAGGDAPRLLECVGELPVEIVARHRGDRLAAAVGQEQLELHPAAADVHVRGHAVERRVAREAIEPLRLRVGIARLDLEAVVDHRHALEPSRGFLLQQVEADLGGIGLGHAAGRVVQLEIELGVLGKELAAALREPVLGRARSPADVHLGLAEVVLLAAFLEPGDGVVEHLLVARSDVDGPDPAFVGVAGADLDVAVLKRPGRRDLLRLRQPEHDVGLSKRPFSGRRDLERAERVFAIGLAARRALSHPTQQRPGLRDGERGVVGELADVGVGIPRRHAAREQDLLDHRGHALDLLVAGHRPRPDVAGAVAGHALVDQDGHDVLHVRDRRGVGAIAAVEVDDAAAGGGPGLGHGLAVEELVERCLEITLRRLGLLRALDELVVDRAAVEDGPVLRADGDHLGRALHAEMPHDALGIVLEHRQVPEAQFAGLAGHRFGVVGRARVDEQQLHAAMAEAILERPDLWCALPRDRATVGGEEEDHCVALGTPQFMHPSALVEQREVEDLLCRGLRGRQDGGEAEDQGKESDAHRFHRTARGLEAFKTAQRHWTLA